MPTDAEGGLRKHRCTFPRRGEGKADAATSADQTEHLGEGGFVAEDRPRPARSKPELERTVNKLSKLDGNLENDFVGDIEEVLFFQPWLMLVHKSKTNGVLGLAWLLPLLYWTSASCRVPCGLCVPSTHLELRLFFGVNLLGIRVGVIFVSGQGLERRSLLSTPTFSGIKTHRFVFSYAGTVFPVLHCISVPSLRRWRRFPQ